MPNIRYAAVSQLAGRLPVKMSSWLAPADLEMTLYDPKCHTYMTWQIFYHWHNRYPWGAPVTAIGYWTFLLSIPPLSFAATHYLIVTNNSRLETKFVYWLDSSLKKWSLAPAQ